MTENNPLLLTLALDNEAQLYFNRLRGQYFPPERNFLDAHLMLFHNLPKNENTIINEIKAVVMQYKPIHLQVAAVASIGRGVAYKVVSGELQLLHKQLQKQWERWLIPQDKNKLWPHITIQNKVSPDVAKVLQEKLSAGFEPFAITGTGISVWEYQNGPWEFMETFSFDQS